LKTLHTSFVLLSVISIVSLAAITAHASEVSRNADPSLDSKVEQLTTTLYCFCGCTRETIQHCVCGNSQRLKKEFREEIAAGATVEQLRNEYIAQYGTQYSAVMPAKGFNIVAYVMPVVIIALLGVIVFLVLKSKRASQLTQQPVPIEKKPSAPNDLYKQIETELERYKQQR